MTDAPKEPEKNAGEGPKSVKRMPVFVHAQYMKDLSFENPNAPDTLKSGAGGPALDMDIRVEAEPKPDGDLDNLVEVSLMMRVTAKREDTVYFIAEVNYAALVAVQKDLPDETIQNILYVQIPNMTYPFARHILSTVTQGGGYPALMLSPVDFRAMFAENRVDSAFSWTPREKKSALEKTG